MVAKPIAGGRRVEMSHSPPRGEVRMVAFRGCRGCRSAFKRAESSLAETPRSPPKLKGNLLKSKALERILAATTEDFVSARGRSVSSPVQAPLGYVEWSDGRIQVLLAGDGQVCLVPVGDVPGDTRADVGSSGWSAETAKGSRLAVAQRAPPSSGQGIGQESARQPAVAMSHSPPPTAIDTFALLEGGGPLGGEQEGPGLEPITEPRAPAFGLRSHVPMLDNRSDPR